MKLAAVTAATLVAVTGCSSATSTPTSEIVRVFAAASLTDTFTQIGQEFEEANPGVTVTFSFGGSADLATQIAEGAPADVFASANQQQMAMVEDAGLTTAASAIFATNVLTVIVPNDNPAHVTSIDDLSDPNVASVVCAPQVPCGAATVTLADAYGFTIPAVSEENSVTDVLGKVSTGEADAGLIYVTDVARADGTITAIPLDKAALAMNNYPIAAMADSPVPDAAAAFVDFVTGVEGREILVAAGFGAP